MAINQGYVYRSQVGSDRAGQTLLDYLSNRWRHSTRDEWEARLTRGEVDLDWCLGRSDDVLRAGQHVTWRRPPWREADVPLRYDLLYEDEALVGVSKPSGLPTLAAGGFLASTLTTLIRSQYPEARPMHRLGRFTSGVVVFARTAEAAAVIAAAWRSREIEKRYRALASGLARRDEYVIDTPIGTVAHRLLGSLHAASSTGKPSHSVARVLQRRATSTLFDVEITTGRPHQIRIHLASIGHPLVGDPLYTDGGIPCPDSTALPGDGGYSLHAERLRFAHPLSGTAIEICATPPPQLVESVSEC